MEDFKRKIILTKKVYLIAMSESWPITEFGTLTIRQTAAVDFRTLHKALFNWAEENKYFYNEKTMQEKAKSHGKEIDIVWQYERKITEFIKFKIEVAIWARGMNPTKEGKLKGDIEVILDSEMEMDWQNRWQTSPFHKFLRSLYIYYLKKQYFLNYAGKCWVDTYSMHAIIKANLNQLTP